MPVKTSDARRARAHRDARAATSCGAAARAPAVVARARLRARAALPAEVRRRRRASARPEVARGPREVSVHDQDGPARQLSVRDVRRAARAGRRASTRRRARPASRRSSATRRKDIDTWATVMARSIRAAGGRAGDIIHVAYGYGLFTGGLGAHYGAEKLGATVIPMSGGHDRAAGAAHPRLQAGHHHGDAVVHAGDRRGDGAAGHRPARLVAQDRHLRRRALDAGDAHGDRGASSTSTRSTSTGSPRSSARASRRNASRPRTASRSGRTTSIRRSSIRRPARCCRDGEKGELVFTSLTKEALPMIRYRTRDLTRLLPPTARVDAPDGEDHRPLGRHADHPRRQRVPDADRGADPEGARARAALPARDHAAEEPRRDGGAGRALAGGRRAPTATRPARGSRT